MADDHALMLEDIRAILAPHYEIVGTVADGRALVEEALHLRPDLIIVDITMPLLNLRRRNPEKEEPTRLAYRSPASTAELTKHAIEHDRGGEPGVISGLIWVAVETVDPSGAIL